MAKKIVIVDVEETLEDKVSKYRRRFHIMSFISLFLVLGFIIHETDSTKKLTLEMNKNLEHYDETFDDTYEEEDLIPDISSNILSNTTSNVVSNSNSNVVSNKTSNKVSNVVSNKTSNKKVSDIVSNVKSANVVEKFIETVSPKNESATKVVSNTTKSVDTKISSFENDSWDTIFDNKSNYKVGDTKKISINGTSYTLIIKNISTNDCDIQTNCGFIIEFVEPIYIESNNIREYLNNEVLGKRLRECCNILLGLEDKDIIEIFGEIDTMKVRSSMTLFDYIVPNDIFGKVLDKYYMGERDNLTLEMFKSLKLNR